MKRIAFCAAIVLFTVCSNAQSQSRAGRSALSAYARGNDSYLLYSDKYKPEKKYTVFKLWNESDPINEAERTELASLKSQLAKKNIEVVEVQWKNKEDLESIFKKYNYSVEVFSDKHIFLRSQNMNLNTTSGKAVLVFEDNLPTTLCSGKDCEENLKYFFGIRGMN